MVSTLETPNFHIWRQTRTGLLSYPLDEDRARAHLANSVYVQMAIQPHIVHVVGYTEAHHAATAEEVIASCKMAHKAIESALYGKIDLVHGENIQQRVEELVSETQVLIDSIRRLGSSLSDDPLIEAATLAEAVKIGLLDAPQLINNKFGCGEIQTGIDGRGACICIDKDIGKPVLEKQRIALALTRRMKP
jgi:glutamate mutase epsilon subunit